MDSTTGSNTSTPVISAIFIRDWTIFLLMAKSSSSAISPKRDSLGSTVTAQYTDAASGNRRKRS